MYRTKITSLVFCLLLVSPWTLSKSDKQLHHFRFMAFGTYIEVMISGVPKGRAAAANTLVQNQFQRMHKRWHSWNKSVVSQLNLNLKFKPSVPTAVYRWHKIPADLQALLIRAQDISIKSNHQFNPAIADLVKLWGFNDAYKPRTQPPSPALIKKLVLQQPRMSDLIIVKNKIRTKNFRRSQKFHFYMQQM